MGNSDNEIQDGNRIPGTSAAQNGFGRTSPLPMVTGEEGMSLEEEQRHLRDTLRSAVAPELRRAGVNAGPTRFLIWLSGADGGLLAEYATDRPKYVSLGGTVLASAVTAAAAMVVTLDGALSVSLAFSLLAAVAWGFTVLSVDRFLVTTLFRAEHAWRYLLGAIPRLFFSVLTGAIVSVPLTLSVFNAEITRQLAVGRVTAVDGSDLLARLRALDELQSGNPIVLPVELLLFVFFVVVGCLPVTLKILLNAGPENAYEATLRLEERTLVRVAQQMTARRYLMAVREQDAQNEESERLEAAWRREVLPGIVEDALRVRERISRARLAEWEKKASAEPGDDSGIAFTPYSDSRVGPISWLGGEPRPRFRTRLAAGWNSFRKPPPRSQPPRGRRLLR